MRNYVGPGMAFSPQPPSAAPLPHRWLRISTKGAPSIRATLALLVVVCVLPISLVAGLLFLNYYEREQIQLSKSAINRAQSLVLSVDREFAAAQSALLALSTSHRLALSLIHI